MARSRRRTPDTPRGRVLRLIARLVAGALLSALAVAALYCGAALVRSSHWLPDVGAAEVASVSAC